MHICVGNLAIIGSVNGLSPGRRQAIIWTNAGILLIGPIATNFSEILIKIITFSFKKMRSKVSSGKRRPSCLYLKVLSNNDNWNMAFCCLIWAGFHGTLAKYDFLSWFFSNCYVLHHDKSRWWCVCHLMILQCKQDDMMTENANISILCSPHMLLWSIKYLFITLVIEYELLVIKIKIFESRTFSKTVKSGIILCMCPANERWRYSVTSSLIGWAHTQNDPYEMCPSPKFGVKAEQIYFPQSICLGLWQALSSLELYGSNKSAD